MTKIEELEEEFSKYNPIIFDLSDAPNSNIDISKTTYDVHFSNNISYPEIKLGFHHYIHQAKDKMEVLDEFANRKKIYLVTSLFEKNIDYKEFTDDQTSFTSIDIGLKSFLAEIKKDFPSILNRAFLKMWEMIIIFNLIPSTEDFVSASLCEGPGSFIQAIIYFRALMVKLSLIKTSAKDRYYGVTLHSDHEHLLMHKNFINYFNKDKPQRLHVLETKSIESIKDLYGGGGKKNASIANAPITNGDITQLNTIKIFAGGSNKTGFSEPSFLITSDAGIDWKSENLQEQEAHRLIFSQIVTALKIQIDGGNFLVKIFESYTTSTIKMIEFLRTFYTKVWISKPYSSRISNSEKYVICKGFIKNKLTTSIIKKLEDMILVMNKNLDYNILDIFTDIKLSYETYKYYKEINTILLNKQYTGINNIIKFINLDNYNGIEYNEFLDRQIYASYFWNKMFLESSNFKSINKYFSTYDLKQYLVGQKKLIKQPTKLNTEQQNGGSNKIIKSLKNNIKLTTNISTLNIKNDDSSIYSSDDIVEHLSLSDSNSQINLANIGKKKFNK